jgi:hypothetical protein
VAARASTVATRGRNPAVDDAGSLPARNRRTAAALVAWILVLMLVSALVAWLRN